MVKKSTSKIVSAAWSEASNAVRERIEVLIPAMKAAGSIENTATRRRRSSRTQAEHKPKEPSSRTKRDTSTGTATPILRSSRTSNNVFTEPLRLLSRGIPMIDAYILEPGTDLETHMVRTKSSMLVTTEKMLHHIYRNYPKIIDDKSSLKAVALMDLDYDGSAAARAVEIFKACLKARNDETIDIQGLTKLPIGVYASDLLSKVTNMFDARESHDLGPAPFQLEKEIHPEELVELRIIFWNLLGVKNDWFGDLLKEDLPADLLRLHRFSLANDILKLHKRLFFLCGEVLSWIPHHQDIFNSTWIECLVGMKAWFLHVGAGDLNEFAAKGCDWEPPVGSCQIIPLVPGMKIIMLPGRESIHSVLGLQDTLARGGQFWDLEQMDRILDNMLGMFWNYPTTNEQVFNDIPEMMDVIRQGFEDDFKGQWRVKEERDRRYVMKCLNAIEEHLRAKIVCGCKVVKRTKLCQNCKCRRESAVKELGCTIWCHPGVPCELKQEGMK